MFTRLKKLTDSVYSPTTPASEAAIRLQVDGAIQELYDALDSIVAGSSGSELVKSAPISGITGSTVYAQIANIYTQLTGIVLGLITDNTITDAKLVDTAGQTKDLVSKHNSSVNIYNYKNLGGSL